MDPTLDLAVRRRANDRCEYCRMLQAYYPARFHIEHIVARKHGGASDPGNLALACLRCNLYKGPNIAGVDPASGRMERLFHPRQDRWSDHFAWAGTTVVGRTAVGRATIEVLRMNHPDATALRASLRAEGVPVCEPDPPGESGV